MAERHPAVLAALSSGDPNRAAQLSAPAVQANPRDSRALFLLGIAFAQGAIAHIRHASPHTLDTIGCVLGRLGDHDGRQ